MRLGDVDLTPLHKLPKVKVNALAFAHMVDALLLGGSAKELSEHCGLNIDTTKRYVRMMRKVGCIHVESWQRDARGAESIAVYVMGRGKDAQRNKISATRAQARYREKQRQKEIIAATAGRPRPASVSTRHAKDVQKIRRV